MGKYAFLLIVLGLVYAIPSFSQSNTKGSVRGVIVDSIGNKQPLQNATVSVRPLGADSTQAEYAVSNKQGVFVFRGLPVGQYFILITYEGYAHVGRNVRITDSNANVDLSAIYLQRSDELLEAAIVQRPPMGIKKDTVEYSAGLFATKPNATAEDLIKKMPGIQVDNSGNVTAQGETVQRVLVNGKRFFSDDPKMATRNLPPDVIDKIQVFDDLSDQSKFTGFDDGNRVKTINIVTKKNMRKGYFGKFVAGAGSDEDYDESLNIHRFWGDNQVSLLGQGNDVNKQNFTAQDIFGGGGGGRRGGGGGGGVGGGGGGVNSAGSSGAATSFQSPGVTTVWGGGLNYKNSFDSGKIDLTGSYFFNFEHTVNKITDSSNNNIPTSDGQSDSTTTSSGNSIAISRIENHRIYFNLEDRFDSNNSLIFRPNVILQHSYPNGSSFSTLNNANGVVYTENAHTSSSNRGFSVPNTDLQFRHRFGKQFRTISLDISGSASVNNGYGYLQSLDSFYQPPTGPSSINLNQYYNDSLHSVNIVPTLSYTEPLSKHSILQLNYSHNYTHSRTINNTFDFVDSVKQYSKFDSLFSNSYTFTSNADNVSLAWRLQEEKYNLSFGSGIQWMEFTSVNTTKNDLTVKRPYTNFTPTINFMYNFSTTQHFRLNYSGRTGTPSAAQLQPIMTTSDSINYQLGNPNLKPQFTQSLRMLYASFDPSTRKVLFVTVNASMIQNDIQSLQYNRANGGTVSTYTNLNGTYNLSGYVNYGFPLARPKSNMNFITNVNYSQSQTLLSSDSTVGPFTHLYTRNTTLAETISWTTNIKKNFDMNLSSKSSYTIPSHSGFQTGNSKNQSNSSLNYFTEVVSTEFTAYTNSGWLIAATFDYTYTYTHSQSYNVSAPIFSPSVAKQFFKKKNAELRLTVFDLFNENTIVTKSVGNNTSFTRNNVLSRYGMLTFTYNLNNFPGAQRRGNGMFPGQFMGRPPGGGGGFRGGPLYPID